MRLIHKILILLSLTLLTVLTAWTFFFYFTMIDEINDEVDDSLEDYSELIIIRFLAGKELPSENDGSNNSYSIRPVTREEAALHPAIKYYDADIYIKEKEEEEPARVLQTIFTDRDDNYFLLEVSTPSFEKEDLRESVTYWIVFLYIVLLLTLLLVCTWVFYRSLKPLYLLLRWLDDYIPGQHHTPVPDKTNIVEFRKLNEAAAKAVERSERLLEQQKQFIGNASHELQTPLAICNNRIEWLIDNTEPPEDSMRELFKIKHTIDYIIRLNKSLLFLSRIDSGQLGQSRQVEINSIVHRLQEDYKEIFAHNHLNVTLEEKGTLTIIMNETLAEALIANLLKNAYIHNRNEGHIRIFIDGESLAVTNTGQPEPLDGVRIFDRFYQGHRKNGSTGLGLAITKAICSQYGLRLSYSYENGEHVFLLSRGTAQ